MIVAAIGLAGVVVGQQMSRGAAQESHYLQIEEQRRLELRHLLVRLIVDARAQIKEAWVLLPALSQFQSNDFTEFVETDTGRAMRERARRVEEDVTALSLLVPEGALRASLSQLDAALVRDWSDKAVGPVTNKHPPEDGRGRVEAALAHVSDCQLALNEAQREAARYLAAAPHRPPSLAAQWAARLRHVMTRLGRRRTLS